MFRRTRPQRQVGKQRSSVARSNSPTRSGRQRRLRFEPLETRRLLSITVNTLNDELDGSIVDGDVSLRDALLAATPFETINFHSSLTAGGPTYLNLNLGELRITKSVIVDGPGAGLLTIDATPSDVTPQQNNGDGSRVFNINDGSSFTNIEVRLDGLSLTGGDVAIDGGAIRNLENLTISDVQAFSNWAGQDGGGIFSSGSLLLINSQITGNVASREGGGIFSSGTYFTIHGSGVNQNNALRGGGIVSKAAGNYLTVMNSSITTNYANTSGGGAVLANGNARFTNSAIDGNRSRGSGAGIHATANRVDLIDSRVQYNRVYGYNYSYVGGGVMSDSGVLNVVRTTITGSRSPGDGGGIWKRSGSLTIDESTLNNNFSRRSGGGIFTDAAVLSVKSSTISGNRAVEDGGGLRVQTAVNQSASIANSTIAFNRARTYYGGFGAGGGIITSGSTVVNLSNTIVASNVRAGVLDDIFGRVTSQYSLIGVDTGAIIINNGGNKIGNAGAPIDPLLSFLTSNGGPTQTHMLQVGSPAIDAGGFLGNMSEFDQRGATFGRIRNGDGVSGAQPDMGALEVQPSAIRGQKWHDFDGDGLKDPGEPGLPGWTIFRDENSNGQFDVQVHQIQSTNVPITVFPFNSVSSTIQVSGLSSIEDLNVTLDITQPVAANSQVYLSSPSGYGIYLFYNVGGNGSNFTNTTFDDEAQTSIFNGVAPFTGSFQPVSPLSIFDGHNPNGTWYLNYYNYDSFQPGTLNSWSLSFTQSERTTITDADGNYAFEDLIAGTYSIGEVQQPGWEATSPGFSSTVLQLNANYQMITSHVPDIYHFFDGDFGSYIDDGGDDMYDGGNKINTNLAGEIPYTGGAVVPGDSAFGPGSQYFTAKFPGLFVLGANDISIDLFAITGNLGADGSGAAEFETHSIMVNDELYTVFIKRVFDAFDPSVNQIIMVPGSGAGITQRSTTNTDDDFNALFGLSSDRIYYALVARSFGQSLLTSDALGVARELLKIVGQSGLHSVFLAQEGIAQNVDFGNRSQPGSITGQSWHDFDGDGVRDAGEPGLPGWSIFLDQNGNGLHDTAVESVHSTGAPIVAPPFAFAESTLVVSGQLSIQDINLTLDLAGIDPATEVTLMSPSGTLTTLFGNLNAGNNFNNTTLDDEAATAIADGATPFSGSFRPQNPLSTFDGEDPNGIWTLYFSNFNSPQPGTLNSWSMSFTHEELSTTTDSSGNYSFTNLPPGEYTVVEAPQPNWTQTTLTDIGVLLNRLNENHTAISSLVPNRYDFTEGESGFVIEDGGQDMYDFGNFLSTNLASGIEYTNGVVRPSLAFGPDGQYFTAKYPGLFVMAATGMSIDTFEISGDLGANSLGGVRAFIARTFVNGREYTISCKRVQGTLTPAVNHILIFPGNNPGLIHTVGRDTNSDQHIVPDLSSVSEMYYLLVAGTEGALLSDADVIDIVHEFAGNLIGGSQVVNVDPGETETANFGNLFVPPVGLSAVSEPEHIGDLSTLLAKDAVATTIHSSSSPSLASLFHEPMNYRTVPLKASPLFGTATIPATESPQLLFAMDDALHFSNGSAVEELTTEDRDGDSTDDVSSSNADSLDEVFLLLGAESL